MTSGLRSLAPRSTSPLLLALLIACGPSPATSTDTGETGTAGEPMTSGETGTGETPEPTGGDDTGPPPATIAEACEALFEQRVASDLRCLGPAPTPADAQGHIESCIAIAGAPGSTLTVADITACAGQLAGECVLYEAHPPCVGAGADLLYPDGALLGTPPPGAPCLSDLQCDTGSCSAQGTSVCGVCQRLHERGDSCEPEDVCVQSECIAGVCDLGGKQLGEACLDFGDECQRDLFCRPSAPGEIEGVCVARSPVGAACAESSHCLDDIPCQNGVCVAWVADGEPCTVDVTPCSSGHCVAGVCATKKAGRSEGQDCSIDYCRRDLLCADDVCTSPGDAPIGGPCVQSLECAEDLFCEHVCTDDGCAPGVCAALPELGEPCGSYGSCGSGATCVDFGFDDDGQQTGECVPLGAAGDPCPCGDQLACIDDTCAPFDPSVCG